MINRRKLDKIKGKISKQFPEFKGIEPKITEKKIRPQEIVYRKLSLGKQKHLRRIYKLRFKKLVETVDEIKMERILIVTLDQKGEIIKITESR